MNSRFLLYMAFFLVLFMIWQQWQIEQNPNMVLNQNQNNAENTLSPNDFPEQGVISESKKSTINSEEKARQSPKNKIGELLVISNRDVQVTIDTIGGTIRKVELLNYFQTTDENSENISLLDYEKDFYIAQSGLLHDVEANNSKKIKLAPNHHDVFSVSKKLDNEIILQWQNESKSISVIKKISLEDSGFKIIVENSVINNSNQVWTGRQYRQIRRKSLGEGRSWVTPTFTGAAYFDGAYNKLSYDEIAEKKPRFNVLGGWVAMMEHYFVSSWFFDDDQKNLFYTKQINIDGVRNDFIIGARSEAKSISPGQKSSMFSTLYAGPKLQNELEKISQGLDLTIDYGVLTFLSKPLFWLLDKIHSFVGNWGWAIIILTLLIKLAFYKLSETSYRSMAKMKQFSPKIQSIRDKYGNDRQKMNQAMMDMYRQEKINPLGGCWPILIQIPVFIALYWVLLESVELRQADFIFWINDLSVRDPYFVLPLLMGISMYFQQKLNPAPPDPMQAKIMQMLPIIFTAFFAFFPAGLVLYWVVNNLLSIAQQWKITKTITSQ